ncbi:MAG: cytochrome c biogenesis protein ResB [Actinomycetota bacterium]
MSTVTEDLIASQPPAPKKPRKKGNIALRAWRKLRTMRTAIILLFVLAAAASIGSFIPQRPVNDLAVFRWKELRPGLGAFFEHLGFFDVYGSAWFMAIYGLLLVSLVGCIVPRYRAFFKMVRSKPKPGVRGSHTFEGTTELSVDRAIDVAEKALRKRRFRTARIQGGVAAERGRSREGGSLIFHTAFLILLLGAGLGKGYGFSGQVAVVEGQGFSETRIAYDSIREGGMFGERHRNFVVDVNEFTVTFRPGGMAKDFVSNVTIRENGRAVRSSDIKVNKPLVHRGVSIFQLAWGWAPRVVISRHGKTLSDGNVIFLPEGAGWRGVLKIPQASPQAGVEMYFFPDFAIGKGDVPLNRSPLPNHPVVLYQEYRGDLGLTIPQSVYFLDKTRLSQGSAGGVALGAHQKLSGGLEISFPDLKKYTVFQVAADPGQWLALLGAALLLVGLIPSLYSSRRRVWVRAESTENGTRVSVSGLALQRKAAFGDEFGTIVRQLGRSFREGNG